MITLQKHRVTNYKSFEALEDRYTQGDVSRYLGLSSALFSYVLMILGTVRISNLLPDPILQIAIDQSFVNFRYNITDMHTRETIYHKR